MGAIPDIAIVTIGSPVVDTSIVAVPASGISEYILVTATALTAIVAVPDIGIISNTCAVPVVLTVILAVPAACKYVPLDNKRIEDRDIATPRLC
jgi:hypothetical protein